LVRSLPQSSRVAILMFESSLTLWSDFTTDRAALDRILDHDLLHGRPPASVREGDQSIARALAGRKRIGTVERAFEAIANALQPLPGSKAICFVGYGIGASPFGTRQDVGDPAVHARLGAPAQSLASDSSTNTEFARAWRALTAARATVFSLDVTESDTH